MQPDALSSRPETQCPSNSCSGQTRRTCFSGEARARFQACLHAASGGADKDDDSGASQGGPSSDQACDASTRNGGQARHRSSGETADACFH